MTTENRPEHQQHAYPPLTRRWAFLVSYYGPLLVEHMLREDGGSYRSSFPDRIVALIDKYSEDKKTDSPDSVLKNIITPVTMAVFDKIYPVQNNNEKRDYKIMQWMIDRVLNDTHNNQQIMAEDFYKIGDNFLYFQGLKASGHIRGAHITQVPSLDVLNNLLKPFADKKEIKDEEKLKRHMTDAQKNEIMRGTTILYDGDDGRVVVPHTVKASQYWGSNTKWCLSGKGADLYFSRHNEFSPVIMILPRGAEKYALVSGKYYDAQDEASTVAGEAQTALVHKTIQGLSPVVRQYVDGLLPKINQPKPTVVNQNNPPEYIGESLRKDPQIIMAAVKQNGWALAYAEGDLSKDPQIAMAAVKQNGLALTYADASLRKDTQIVMAAVEQNGFALNYAHEILRKDSDFTANMMKEIPVFAFRIDSFANYDSFDCSIPDNKHELQIRALRTLIDNGRIGEAQQNMRFIEGVWGDAERIFGAPVAALNYLEKECLVAERDFEAKGYNHG